MKLLGWFAPKEAKTAAPRASVAGGQTFSDLNDPALLEYIRGNRGPSHEALFNTAVFHCIDLISGAIAALPFRPMRKAGSGKLEEAEDHPLYEVLNGQANSYQTSFEFKQLMQMRVLVDGDAFARIARSGNRVIGLLPLDGVTCRLNSYAEPIYTGQNGLIDARDIFHLRGLSWNGVNGMSRVRQACRAVGLAKDAEDAAINVFRNNMAAGGALTHKTNLSADAKDYLRRQMAERAGTANTGKWLILEEGLEAEPWSQTGKDSQQIERSKHQVDEVARVFGVPRPLMGVDDTSWGSGIEQLAILFVRFSLLPWFTAWETRGRMCLLQPAERKSIYMDFDEQELLRGSMKDQADFFSKALGGPGAKGWMTQNEVRIQTGQGRHPDGDGLASGMESNTNVPAQSAAA